LEYIHFDVTQETALVLDDMGLFLPVKNGLCLAVVPLRPDGVTSWVDGHCSDVRRHVDREQYSSQLHTEVVRESYACVMLQCHVVVVLDV